MITTGIIREINRSSGQHFANKYLVEINLFQNAGNEKADEYVYEANCCVAPGMVSTLDVGDKVYVGFLNELYSYPIILGMIYQGQNEMDFRSGAKFKQLQVSDSVILPENTKIGEITYPQLERLFRYLQRDTDARGSGGYKLFKHNVMLDIIYSGSSYRILVELTSSEESLFENFDDVRKFLFERYGVSTPVSATVFYRTEDVLSNPRKAAMIFTSETLFSIIIPELTIWGIPTLVKDTVFEI